MTISNFGHPPQSENRNNEVRAELLSPAELDAAIGDAGIVWLPLGTLEFHSAHLPIGVDALTAHGLCIQAAQDAGGVVLPPLYQGIGGGHSDYPWTIMMTSADDIRSLIEQTLVRLEQFGVTLAVLFTGHFADEQLQLIDLIANEWRQSAHSMRVWATGVNRCATAPIAPDHAAIFETSLLHSFRPELVHLDRLPALASHPALDPDGDPAGLHRHDLHHVLWGIFGPDPRELDVTATADLRHQMVSWLSTEATARVNA